jgi:hypothetical protein
MAKKKNTINISNSSLEDMIWMSYRYCIGRHTIAAAHHAETIHSVIKSNPDLMSNEKKAFNAKDIRREITSQIAFRSNVYVEGCNDFDAFSLLLIEGSKYKDRKDIEFIPAHPMAGKEVYGVENNDPDMFKGANYIITPTSENTLSAIELAKMIGQVLEFRNIAVLTPEEHDEMIGFLSQLTHCIAVSLMTCKDSTHLVEYTGDSFRDLTRIAKINENMWTELFLMNKNQLLAQMDLFLTEFKKLRDALAKEDQESMKEMMRLSTKRRKYFD